MNTNKRRMSTAAIACMVALSGTLIAPNLALAEGDAASGVSSSVSKAAQDDAVKKAEEEAKKAVDAIVKSAFGESVPKAMQDNGAYEMLQAIEKIRILSGGGLDGDTYTKDRSKILHSEILSLPTVVIPNQTPATEKEREAVAFAKDIDKAFSDLKKAVASKDTLVKSDISAPLTSAVSKVFGGNVVKTLPALAVASKDAPSYKAVEHTDDNLTPPGDTSDPGEKDQEKPGRDTEKPTDDTKPGDEKPGKDTEKPKPTDEKKPGGDTEKPKPTDDTKPGDEKPGKDTEKPKPTDEKKPTDTEKPKETEKPDPTGENKPSDTDKPSDENKPSEDTVTPGGDTAKPDEKDKNAQSAYDKLIASLPKNQSLVRDADTSKYPERCIVKTLPVGWEDEPTGSNVVKESSEESIVDESTVTKKTTTVKDSSGKDTPVETKAKDPKGDADKDDEKAKPTEKTETPKEGAPVDKGDGKKVDTIKDAVAGAVDKETSPVKDAVENTGKEATGAVEGLSHGVGKAVEGKKEANSLSLMLRSAKSFLAGETDEEFADTTVTPRDIIVDTDCLIEVGESNKQAENNDENVSADQHQKESDAGTAEGDNNDEGIVQAPQPDFQHDLDVTVTTPKPEQDTNTTQDTSTSKGTNTSQSSGGTLGVGDPITTYQGERTPGGAPIIGTPGPGGYWDGSKYVPKEEFLKGGSESWYSSNPSAKRGKAAHNQKGKPGPKVETGGQIAKFKLWF